MCVPFDSVLKPPVTVPPQYTSDHRREVQDTDVIEILCHYKEARLYSELFVS